MQRTFRALHLITPGATGPAATSANSKAATAALAEMLGSAVTLIILAAISLSSSDLAGACGMVFMAVPCIPFAVVHSVPAYRRGVPRSRADLIALYFFYGLALPVLLLLGWVAVPLTGSLTGSDLLPLFVLLGEIGILGALPFVIAKYLARAPQR